jgi:hypothetical protein
LHPFRYYLIFASIAGGIAGYTTTCFDTVRTHLQTRKYLKNDSCPNGCNKDVLRCKNMRNLLKITSEIWKCQGIVGFFRGALARSVMSSASSSLAWMAYEILKYFFLHNYS